jgi:hypothetical protein
MSTPTGTTAGGKNAMIISRDDMEAHIRAGHAQPWSRATGPDRLLWTAARIWWAVLPGDGIYRPAPTPLTDALNSAQDVLLLPAPPLGREDLTREREERVARALTQVSEVSARTFPASAMPRVVINQPAMTVHLQSGAARAWAPPLGDPSSVGLDAVRTWYFVREGEDFYRLAPAAVATTWDEACAGLAEIDRQKEGSRRQENEGAPLP